MQIQKFRYILFLGFHVWITTSYADIELERSNQITTQFTHELALYLPEKASEIGFVEYDDKAGTPTVDFDEKLLSVYQRWYRKLLNFATQTNTHDEFIDLKLLNEYIQNQIKAIKFNHSEKVVPFVPGTQVIFQNLKFLMNSQASEQRKISALKRFHAYVESNTLNHYQQYIQAALEKYSEDKALYPSFEELSYYLESSPIYIKAVEELLKNTNQGGFETDFAQYQKQAEDFDRFIKQALLPKARQSPAMPETLYRQQLKKYGVKEANPDAMIQVGQADYALLYQEYQGVAQKIAEKNHLENQTPTAVIAFLKQDAFTSPEQVLSLYQKISDEIEGIIKNHHIVSLPNEPLKIRLASLAESKAMPAPYIQMPPRINHEGMVPEFVVPRASHGLPYDDFTYPSITSALMAHEGRPGHDLHLRRVLEPEMSLVRASYAENPVNYEGWALYAEDLIYPYVSLEAQFGILQLRLLRIARYFLDPLIHKNQATKKDVLHILHEEIGLSKALAEVEYQRYAYIAPAQATTYYHGLLKIRALKKTLTEEFGELSTQCFHDTLLSFGLMPTEYVSELKERFKPCVLASRH